ncbi:DNA mismatch repair endonuclease MutH [hydrothermal vent metagenome]|uniref:DNA mismatch repair endonuclease MutH n=1 Tax=hydrothermal vent metagenome TaxID=652676 RepID=A0A3B1B5B2_9ZZZZ
MPIHSIPFPAPPPQSEAELLTRAQQLAGLTLGQLAAIARQPLPASAKSGKGWCGQILEQFLGASAGSRPEPDFTEIGVELKTLPLNTAGQPKESTYVCSVPLKNNRHLRWDSAWLRLKLQRVLWLPLEADTRIPFAQRRLATALLWSPSTKQEALLKQDWEEHMDKICLGQLGNISARDGEVLQIRPKAAHSRVLCQTSGDDGAPAQTLPRGFYLRTKFTRDILQQHYAVYT